MTYSLSFLRALLLCPAVMFATGNLVFALAKAEVVGITVNALIVLAAWGSRIYELASGKSFGLPFYVLAVVNIITAASILQHSGFSLTELGALAFLCWGVGHGLAGYYTARDKVAKTRLLDFQLYYGVGNLAINPGNLYAGAVFLAGTVLALVWPQVYMRPAWVRPVTPNRLYALAFFIAAGMSFSTPGVAVANLLWAVACASFDLPKRLTERPA